MSEHQVQQVVTIDNASGGGMGGMNKPLSSGDKNNLSMMSMVSMCWENDEWRDFMNALPPAQEAGLLKQRSWGKKDVLINPEAGAGVNRQGSKQRVRSDGDASK